MDEFENVVPVLGQALSKRGFTDLTPIQEAVIDPGLAEADLLVSAQTGSGKTIAFGLALAPTLLDGAERFSHAPAPLALVVAPTRELALQVKRELQWLYAMTDARLASCVGGMDMREERRTLQRRTHIVVGTPGRLRDHIERGSFDTTALKAVVLDEADEMLDLGFREDLEFILNAAPVARRTLMFSATVPSRAPVNTRLQFASAARQKSEAACGARHSSQRRCPMFHRRSVRSEPHESSQRLSSLSCTPRTTSVWPRSRRWLAGSRGSHSRTSLSTDPDATSVAEALVDSV